MPYAPIIVFAFNRIEPLESLFASLRNCAESRCSELYVFVDGARNSTEAQSVTVVREFVSKLDGFKDIHTEFAEKNQGLGPSIISGVSKVMAKHGRAIVLEDDLVLQPNFLHFMNEGLERYACDKRVFSICGYTNKVRPDDDYSYDAYFCTRSSSWGWATWTDRWESVDWNLEPWTEFKKYRRAFNKWGGSDCFGMLEGWKTGRNKSWAIRFCFSQFLQDKVSLFPIKSLVTNDGFDGQGTNCKKWSRFRHELFDGTKEKFEFPTASVVNRKICRQAMAYNGLIIRIWSRLMYIING